MSTIASTFEVENMPNAGKLITSLRSLEYSEISAIQDIVDNGLDADATAIWIEALSDSRGEKSRGIDTLLIADNGVGMTKEVLDQALRLGSDTDKNPNWDLGLYGMGLVTASISMGKRLEVYTRCVGGQALIGVQDLDVIVEKNAFVKELREQTPEEQAFFEGLLARFSPNATSGTLVKITNIDRFEWARLSAFESKLRKSIGQTFRKFIQADRCKFFVNNEEQTAIDPIFDFKPTVLAEESIDIDGEQMLLVITELPWHGEEIDRGLDFSIPNQGFYVLRNQREIAAAQTLGVFTRHNSYNRFRAELSYPATLDSALNTPFSKQSVRLDQSVKDKVTKIANPFLRQIRRNAVARVNSEKLGDEDFTNVSKHISKKAHLLKTPQVQVEERSPRTTKDEPRKAPAAVHNPRLDITKRKRIDADSLNVSFEHAARGEKAPLFEPDQRRDVVIITWNTDHPFYQSVVVPNAQNPAVFNPIAYLVYCYASAELISKDNSDSQEIMDNIRWEVGRNLAVLMK